MLKTKTDIQRFTIPDGKTMKKEIVFNNGLTGLYFAARRNPSGVITKSWRYIVGSSDITLGTYPAYSLEEARKWHLQQVQKTRQGFAPTKTLIGKPTTMDGLVKEWLEVKCAEPSKPGRNAIWNKHGKALHSVAPEQLTYHHVYSHLLAMGVSNASHRMCQIIKMVMLYAFQVHGIQGQQPGQPVYVPQKLSEIHDRKKVADVIGKIRDNHLQAEQYRILWHSLGNTPSHAAMRFIMVFGTRKSESAKLVWPEIDLKAKTWILPAERTKTKQERVYPLPDYLISLLEEWSWTKHNLSKQIWTHIGHTTMSHSAVRLRESVGNDFTTHDLRRSTASMMSNEAGIDPIIVDLMLGHSLSMIMSKILATYQPKAFQKKVNKAWPVWFQWFEKNVINKKPKEWKEEQPELANASK